MNAGRFDKPQIDTDENFVFFNSPAVGVLPSGKAHHTELAFGWDAANPFTMEMSIILTSGSVIVNEHEFPYGLSCMRCLMPIEWGSIGCSVNGFSDIGDIICIACGRDEINILQEETWRISLDHVREAIKDQADYEPGLGDVRITRPAEDCLMFRLGRNYKEYMFINVPFDRISLFVQEIDNYLDEKDQEAVRAAYLDHGLEMLEKELRGDDD